jgi:hypothetical protein
MIHIIQSLVGDVFVVAGIVLIAAGLWLIYPPLAMVVVGFLFLVGGSARSVIGGSFRRKRYDRPD